jgi:glycine hydroxymethyltransferase
MLEPNDTIIGMRLDHGGHLTHGAKVNFSGKNYTAYQYGLHPETYDIDYDHVRDLAKVHNPKMIIAGFSAFSGTIDWKIFRDIADESRVLIFLLIWLMYQDLLRQVYILLQFHMLML